MSSVKSDWVLKSEPTLTDGSYGLLAKGISDLGQRSVPCCGCYQGAPGQSEEPVARTSVLFVGLVTCISLLLLLSGEKLQDSLTLSLIFCGFQ